MKKLKKVKGVNKNIVKIIRHEEYKKYIDVLINKNIIWHKMKRSQNELYKIVTYNVCKISLYCFDDKRYILNDGINTLVYPLRSHY